jgi:hypothetical protein
MPTTRQVRIYDPALAVVRVVLYFAIIFITIRQIAGEGSHYMVEIPTGFPTIEFLRKAPDDLPFNDARDASPNPFRVLPYCAYEMTGGINDPSNAYEYLKPAYDQNGAAVSPVFSSGLWTKASNYQNLVGNDDNIKCEQINFAELIKKDLYTARLTTYQTKTLSTVHDCASLTNKGGCIANRESPDSTILETAMDEYSNRQSVFETKEDKDGLESCTCLEKSNTFAMAPEYIGVEIYHDYQGSADMGNIYGSTLNKASETNVAPHTYIKRRERDHAPGTVIDLRTGKWNPTDQYVDPQCAHDDCADKDACTKNGFCKELADRLESPFEAGQAIKLSVRELLLIAGTSLDKPVAENAVQLLNGQHPPMRRTTGVRLSVDFEYDVHIDNKDAECIMYVSFSDGITAWSKDVQMNQRQNLNEPGGPGSKFGTQKADGSAEVPILRQYTEFVDRGVMIQFSAKGKLKKFSFEHLINVLVAALVFLPFVTPLVLSASALGPKKKVYDSVLREKIDADTEIAKAGIEALNIGCMVEDLEKKGRAPGKRLTLAQLIKAYETSGMQKKQAETLATSVFESAQWKLPGRLEELTW